MTDPNCRVLRASSSSRSMRDVKRACRFSGMGISSTLAPAIQRIPLSSRATAPISMRVLVNSSTNRGLPSVLELTNSRRPCGESDMSSSLLNRASLSWSDRACNETSVYRWG